MAINMAAQLRRLRCSATALLAVTAHARESRYHLVYAYDTALLSSNEVAQCLTSFRGSASSLGLRVS